ncbi:hypothetical protein [Chryseobacterium polytrichastri]|uniref:Uncharacterized protein n=1 Tax=Chryseobacterium polytrichastri TaxID=1302687 RepID=A0A1M6PU56_9FLAO|nr:hypothetical protein [Chryseobacterium polytrichastri]SHK11451.1 hypothetical protein SAMN05444267_1001116 [Chryseobacterium polytrichastri]
MDPKENNKGKSSEIQADKDLDTSSLSKKTKEVEKENSQNSTTNKSGKTGG